ncbi:MAG: hypothetical protein ACJ8G3_11640, partial [Burkholderiaceae bacterium]
MKKITFKAVGLRPHREIAALPRIRRPTAWRTNGVPSDTHAWLAGRAICVVCDHGEIMEVL